MVSLDNLVGLVSVFGIFGVRGVNIPKDKNPGKCHDLERKCKMLIQEGQGAFPWGFRCQHKGGGAFEGGGVWVRNSKIYRKYMDVQRKFKCLTREG